METKLLRKITRVANYSFRWRERSLSRDAPQTLQIISVDAQHFKFRSSILV